MSDQPDNPINIASYQGLNKPQKWRFYVVICAFILGFTTIGIRLIDVAYNGSKLQAKSSVQNQHRLFKRLDIVDRNGVLLATNLKTASLYANPKIILDAEEAAKKLHKILPELNYKQLLTLLSSDKNFVWIKRNLVPREQYQINNLGIPGLFFEKEEKRIYPHGALAAHIIGFVGIDGNGLAGIEKYFDNKLNGKEGDFLDNQPLTLSIDIRIQNIVQEELASAMEEFKAVGAVGIVLNAKNGEIIAAVSLPNFDPHNPGNATADQLFNRFSLGLYEPGSTSKIFTVAMALDNNTISLKDMYNVSSPIHIAKFNIKDYHARHGLLTIPEIFMYSSNIGISKIIMDVGKKHQQQMMKAYNLLDVIEELELPEKSSPLYPSVDRWGELSMMTISYGHGIALTPMHMIKAGAAMVNGGNLVPVTLAKRLENQLFTTKKVLSELTSMQMRKLLRLVVEHGTGKRSEVPGYWVGGKTGTANKNKHGAYSVNSRLSSFLSGFPIYDPEYVMLIMLDEPKGNASTGGYATAGMTAAPVSGKIIERIGHLLGIKPTEADSKNIKEKLWLDYNSQSEHGAF